MWSSLKKTEEGKGKRMGGNDLRLHVCDRLEIVECAITCHILSSSLVHQASRGEGTKNRSNQWGR